MKRILNGDWAVPAPPLYLIVALFSIIGFASADIYAQAPKADSENTAFVKKPAAPTATAAPAPLLSDYRKATIGASAETLRELWGKPKMEYPDGYLYEMSDTETIQIAIGPDKNITAIAVTFREGKGAPSFAEVFGDGATPEKRENGSVYKMVRYPNAGYWVAYYAGPNNATVSLTMQKL